MKANGIHAGQLLPLNIAEPKLAGYAHQLPPVTAASSLPFFIISRSPVHLQMVLPDSISLKLSQNSIFGALLHENGSSVEYIDKTFRILDAASLSSFWLLNFGNDGRKRKIPDDFWMFHPAHRESICNWRNSNRASQSEAVKACLRSNICRSDDAQMCFFGGVEVVLLTWFSFVEHWSSFVEFNDEGLLSELGIKSGLLISPHSEFISVSSEN